MMRWPVGPQAKAGDAAINIQKTSVSEYRVQACIDPLARTQALGIIVRASRSHKGRRGPGVGSQQVLMHLTNLGSRVPRTKFAETGNKLYTEQCVRSEER